jgi:hypothetical protein
MRALKKKIKPMKKSTCVIGTPSSLLRDHRFTSEPLTFDFFFPGRENWPILLYLAGTSPFFTFFFSSFGCKPEHEKPEEKMIDAGRKCRVTQQYRQKCSKIRR